MSAPLLEVDRVTKRFAYRAGPWRRQVGWITAVADVSLSVAPGQILGLVGESGCGKTTLAKVIAGLEPVASGQVRFQGQALPGGRAYPPAIRRQIQLVFQDPTSSLNPRHRVGATLEEPLLVHRLGTPAERDRAVERLLEQVGLPSGYRRRYPRELSGGERQRVAIARALSLSPALLILDEPVASLDVHIGAQVLTLLRELHARLTLSYLVISHDLRVVGSLCHTVVVMYLGRIVESGPALDVFRRPWHPYTELLLESAGLRAAGAGDRGDVPSPLQPPSGCAFRTRCPLAEPVCRERTPELLPHDPPDRRVACHLRP
jgi:peptide/nickel transport system ATP-binding protein